MAAPFNPTPQGPVPAITPPNVQDYPRLVFSAPYFTTVAIAEIIQPSVNEAVEAILPSLIPPYINPAVDAAIQAQCVLLVGSTMTGALNLSPTVPTAPSMAATKAYVDSMVATVVPEVPAVPAGQAWARETGQWVPLTGGGSVTNINTGVGLTGGPITSAGTISMANMGANSLKGNNTGAVAAPTDIPAGTVLTMIGGAPLNSPNFTGSPSLPTGTAAITQPGGTNNTTVATTAYVTAAIAAVPVGVQSFNTRTGAVTLTLADVTGVGGATAAQLANYLPLTGGAISGNLSIAGTATAPTVATADSSTNIATTAFVHAQNYLPTAGGTITGGLSITGAGTALNVTNNAIISGTLQGNTATFSGTIQGTGLISSRGSSAIFQVEDRSAGPTYAWYWLAQAGVTRLQRSDNNLGMNLDAAGDLSIDGATGTKASGTTWSNPSARDLKENIQPYEAGLAAVLALQPRIFSFAEDSGIEAPGQHIGLIHDETAHMPELHRTVTIGGGVDAPGREVDGLDCSAILFALINATKELNARLTVVEGRA